ncbi:MAG: hypothetical protein PW845_05540 [Pseudomonas sp.]|uniref:hypothetical protein n=1 Tax=Pseudomonas abieticivorans TaxID=2931382 RepID=UPI0020BDDC61|nr:hypothetical protein [Pseudomonas sp. PIA16]MDE1164851.1 hypothetical protein [Pseudomonas sp.]
MDTFQFSRFISQEIEKAQDEALSARSADISTRARARKAFYEMLERRLHKRLTPTDMGTLDALHETLKALRLLDQHETLMSVLADTSIKPIDITG